MATASRHLCRSLIRIASHHPVKRKRIQVQRSHLQPVIFRQFSSLPARYAEKEPTSSAPDFEQDDLQKPKVPYTVADLDPEERADYETMSKEEQAKYLAIQNHVKAVMETEEMGEITDEYAKKVAVQIDREGRTPNFLQARNLDKLRNEFWADDEDDEFGQTPDNDDDMDDSYITTIAENELELHREIREYQRIAAWDLPLLSQFAKPYEPPNFAKQPLRFRYTTYLGETHPAAKKVVVEFNTTHLAQAAKLSPAQRTKLIKLIGVRYNPETDLARMSCEKFEDPAQNKRYLGDLVNKLVTEAKDAKDMFEDIPLDFRHHKKKIRHRFPQEWALQDQESVEKLLEKREDVKLLQVGEPVIDGKRTVELYVRAKMMGPKMNLNR